MSPVRVDTTKNINIDQMLKTVQSTSAIKNSLSTTKLNFKDFIEQELKAPKAAALKQTPVK